MGDRMIRDANPLERLEDIPAFESNQTVELRSPDGSAHVHLLLAGLAVAARYGLEHPQALDVARDLYVAAGAAEVARRRLPASCHEAAECLKRDRARYEDGGVFPPGLIDSIAATLQGTTTST